MKTTQFLRPTMAGWPDTNPPEPPCQRCRRRAGFAAGSVLLLVILTFVPTWPVWRVPPLAPPHERSEKCAPNCSDCHRLLYPSPIGTPGGSVGGRV